MKIQKSNYLLIILVCVIVLQIVLVLLWQKNELLKPYNVEYWKDRYEHSQYQLPLSHRAIGDKGLYAYAGYKLIKGANPFSINVDKPPFGKYLIGISILRFNNPVYYALFFSIGSIILTFLLAKTILKNYIFSLLLVLFLVLDPMFFSQYLDPMLDISQLFFVLLNVYCFVLVAKSSKHSLLLLLLSGLSIGFAIEIKPPLTILILFILEFLYLIRFKKIWMSLPLFIGTGIGMLIPYIPYFMIGNTLIDYLKIHRYMASFYLASQVKPVLASVWVVMVMGRIPDFVTKEMKIVQEWWLIWTLLAGSVLYFCIELIKKKKKVEPIILLLFFFTIITLIAYSLITFYSRYLVLILPFLYIFLFYLIKNHFYTYKKFFVFVSIIFIIYGFTNTVRYLNNQSKNSISNFYHAFSHQFFQDVYEESLDLATINMDRNDFRIVAGKALQDAEIRSIDLLELKRDLPLFASKGRISLLIIYHTQNLGSFSEVKDIELERKFTDWKIKWKWDYILNGFKPGYRAESLVFRGKRGSIYRKNKSVFAEDTPGYLVLINPSRINTKEESEMLKIVSSITNVSPMSIQNAYLEDPLPDTYIPIGTNSIPLNQQSLNELLRFDGVRIEPYSTRIFHQSDPLSIENTNYNECCTRIYSSTNYHGVAGEEKAFDYKITGQDGGNLLLYNNMNNLVKEIKSQKKVDGEDYYQ
jgi:predicted membrane-bound dolichyl-phosphate-mannose-protein mannosyltransferase